MALSKVSGFSIDAICCAVPKKSVEISSFSDQFGAGVVKKISLSTGISSVRIAPDDVCSSDLCFAAAQVLLKEQNLAPNDVDVLIFISQTPDYVLPATACVLQERLGLSNNCATFDVNLGCSGYVYGLWMAAGFCAAKMARRVLVLVGDTISKVVSEEDRSVAMLFGDAGSATLVSAGGDGHAFFDMGTDGAGCKSIIVPAGAFRVRPDSSVMTRMSVDSGRRSGMELVMHGSEVFEFSQSRVPDSIIELLSYANVPVSSIDTFVPHQANKFMLSHLCGKLGLDKSKMVVGMAGFGNTSSASIPLALVTELQGKSDLGTVLFSGFGVGLSWASMLYECKEVNLLPLVEV